MRHWACALVVLALGVGELGTQPLRAADQLPKIIDVRFGFGNRYKLGHWIPVELTLQGGNSATLVHTSIQLPDGADLSTRYRSRVQRPVSLAPGQVTKTVLLARAGRNFDALDASLTLVDSGQVLPQTIDLYRTPSSVPQSCTDGERLYVAFGPSIGFPGSRDAEPLPYEVVSLTDASELPAQALAYDGVDAVWIATSRAELFRQLTPDDVRLEALDHWVHSGGHLIVCVGSQAQELIAPKGLFARFVPGKFVELATLRNGDRLEEYSGSKVRIAPKGRSESIELSVPRLENLSGVVELSADGLPLIIRSPRGFGRLTFVACDLDARPLNGWSGRAALAKKIVGEPTDVADLQAARPASSPYSDLIGQLNNNLDLFPGVRVVPFWIVAVAILGYIVLIGPGDFFFVKHVLRRMELTWLTFPAIVVTVSLVAYFAASWLKGSQLRVNQVDVIDYDAATGFTRGGSWLRLFSPRTTNYTLSLEPPTTLVGIAPSEVTFSWLGVPGSAWRGMNTPTAGIDLLGRQYLQSPALDQLSDVPIDVWSSRGFVARWTAQDTPRATSRLRMTADGSLVGTIPNPTGTELTECFLAYDKWVYKLGKVAEDATVEIKPGQQREGLEMLLKRYEQIQTNQFSSRVNQARPFRTDDERVPPVIRMMMFHEAAGGRDYTTLHHGQATWTDLSSHLKLGRAVFVGEAASEHVAAQLRGAGEPLTADAIVRWTFYRLVLPVTADNDHQSALGGQRD